MIGLSELVAYTDALLQVEDFTDYCPNGLQVEGRSEVAHLVAGVTASQALVDAAQEVGADALLVHHGYFWRGEPAEIVGIKRRRLETLLKAEISLLAYHLPLDAHAEWGNNAQLGQRLGLHVEGRFGRAGGVEIAMHGRLDEPLEAGAFGARLATALGRTPTHVAGGPADIATVGWCTGAAQGFVEAAVEQRLDAFVSGEISEQTAHVAREAGIHYFAAGHHATERYGPWALGEHLAERFGLQFQFIDIDNPA